MVELIAKSPCADLLPIKIGKLEAVEVDLGHLTSIQHFEGKLKPLARAIKAAHDVGVPAANRSISNGGARSIWFGQDQFLLAGPAPDIGLAEHAAMSDQSDAWACVALTGPGAEDVLSRLVPVDVRLASFKKDYTLCTMIQHMNGSVTRLDADRFLLMVFRSMAHTLVHDLTEAMETVAAQG